MTQMTRPRHGPALLASGVMLAAVTVLAGCGSGGTATAHCAAVSSTPDERDHGDRHVLPDAR